MQLNWLNFVIAERLAKDAFEKKGVDGTDKARRLALAGAFWPGGDGGGASLMPVILVKSLAEKAAEEAAAEAAAAAATRTPVAAAPPPANGGGATQDGGGTVAQAVTRAEFDALKTTVTSIDGRFQTYPDVMRPTANRDEGKRKLEELGYTVRVTGSGTTIKAQSPDPLKHNRLPAAGTL